MLSFRHFRERSHAYQPRTPAAALRAVSSGFAEVEELVHQGTSVKPLIEEPYEIMELQRVLARSGLDLQTGLLLVGIFGRMLQDPDPERALFAAEGITTIEGRFSRRIEELERRLATGESSVRLELARRLYELALLNEKTPSIRAFYLREAFVRLRPVIEGPALEVDVLTVAANVLAELALHEQAMSVLAKAREPRNPEVLFLRAQIAFRMRRFDLVSVILRHLRGSYNRHGEQLRMAIDQWAPE